tara:strand:+ start:4818 stop:6476 length:1659 start_codon:yes stop_codon:yes gene_type:complete
VLLNGFPKDGLLRLLIIVAALFQLCAFAEPAQNDDVESKVAAAILQLIARGDAEPSDVGILVEDFIIEDPSTAPGAVRGALELLKDYPDVIQRVVQGAVELAPEEAEKIVAVSIEVAGDQETVIRKSAADALVPQKSESERTPFVEVSSFEPETDQIDEEAPLPKSKPSFGALLDQRLTEFAEAGSAVMAPESTSQPNLKVEVQSGYDSNPTTSADGDGSASVTGRMGVSRNWEGRSIQVESEISGGVTHFFDGQPNLDGTYYEASSRLFAQYAVSDRVSVSNQFQFELDHEADLLGGVATARRVGQYRHLYNRVAIALQASDSVSGSLSYGIGNIAFEEEPLANSEDRFSHIIGAMVTKQIGSKSAVSNSYRYSLTNYDSADRDYRSHLVLLGVDHQFTPHLWGNLGVGAEMRSYQNPLIGRQSLPFVESNLIFLRNSAVQLRIFNRFGLDDRELALLGFQTRQSFRSGVEMVLELSPKTTVTTGVEVLRSEFEGESELHEDAVLAAITGRYQVGANLFLAAGYTFTSAMSDQDDRDFDRHRVWTGITGAF